MKTAEVLDLIDKTLANLADSIERLEQVVLKDADLGQKIDALEERLALLEKDGAIGPLVEGSSTTMHVCRHEPVPDPPYEKIDPEDQKKTLRGVLARMYVCPGCLHTEEVIVMDSRATRK